MLESEPGSRIGLSSYGTWTVSRRQPHSQAKLGSCYLVLSNGWYLQLVNAVVRYQWVVVHSNWTAAIPVCFSGCGPASDIHCFHSFFPGMPSWLQVSFPLIFSLFFTFCCRKDLHLFCPAEIPAMVWQRYHQKFLKSFQKCASQFSTILRLWLL